MRVVYVAGKYRDNRGAFFIHANIERARSVAGLVWMLGAAAVCPHLNTAHFDGLVPEEVFLEGTMEMLRRCDALVVLPGIGESEGTQAEIVEARRLNMPIHHFIGDKALGAFLRCVERGEA